MSDIRAQFDAVDGDYDGFISPHELAELIGGQTQNFQEVLAVADLDHNGVISFSEFAAAWLFMELGRSYDFLRHAFDLFDTNHDGLVTQRDIMRSLNTPQMRELEGGGDLARDLASIFPESQPMKFEVFAQHIVRSSGNVPVRALRFEHRHMMGSGMCGFCVSEEDTTKLRGSLRFDDHEETYSDNDSDLE